MKLTNEPHVPDEFDELVSQMQEHLATLPGPFFVTEQDVVPMFMANVPERQWHTCRCCLNFLSKYGGAYTYVDGSPVTLWQFPGMPEIYAKMCEKMDDLVIRSIGRDDQMLVHGRTWGSGATGQFTHFLLSKVNIQTAADAINYREARERLNYAFKGGFTLKVLKDLRKNAELLQFPRTDKLFPQLDFLIQYLEASPTQKKVLAANSVPGFTHPRTSIVGICVDAINEGQEWSAIRAMYAKSVDTLNYMRPTIAPNSGEIAKAEKLFAEMGLATALERRPIQVSDVPDSAYIWKPEALGLFSKLAAPTYSTSLSMSWAAFKEKILPEALEIVWEGGNYALASMTTQIHADSKPILRWDTPEKRNPVGWWIPTSPWSVPSGPYKVRGVLKSVPSWTTESEVLPGEMIWLDSCDVKHDTYSGLFPECISPDLRDVRSVIEKFNAMSKQSGVSHAQAHCIRMSPGLQFERSKLVLNVRLKNTGLKVTITSID